MANLILLTNSFPYGNWEPYLETEVNYYDSFEAIHICSLQIRKEHLRKVRKLPSDKFKVCPVYYASKYIYLINAMVALTDRNLYTELLQLTKKHQLSFKRIVKLFVYISRSHHEAKIIFKYLKKNGLTDKKDNGVIYSYRFEYQPYVGILLKKYLPRYSIIARAHGYDLYEERNSASYIPLREFLLDKLDKLILIADDGKNYILNKFPQYKNKMIVSRLGTVDCSINNVESPRSSINIVSCSNIVPVKRIDMIVKALSCTEDVDINWTHYGEGILIDKIQEMCRDILPKNIHYEFRGFVDNKKILEEYKVKPYHLFVNVSESEGIPVSIMEVMSFGIPCIATDVGGTKEIVKDGRNGVLLNKNFEPEELAKWIHRFACMEDSEYQRYRHNARTDWKNNYSADKNYTEFIDFLRREYVEYKY